MIQQTTAPNGRTFTSPGGDTVYYLTESDGGAFSLNAKDSDGEDTIKAGSYRPKAEVLAEFLSENAVPPRQLRQVISDIVYFGL